MKDQGIPRFENDDYSHYAGADYRENHQSHSYSRTDERIFEEVCETLMDDPTVNASQITVKVEEGIVILEGIAGSRMEKRVAEMIIAEIPGVLDVRNEIVLSGSNRKGHDHSMQVQH